MFLLSVISRGRTDRWHAAWRWSELRRCPTLICRQLPLAWDRVSHRARIITELDHNQAERRIKLEARVRFH